MQPDVRVINVTGLLQSATVDKYAVCVKTAETYFEGQISNVMMKIIFLSIT